MSHFFFSGHADAKLDDKNRFVLPQSMRFGLIEEGKLDFTIGLGIGGCLAIYRRSDIEKIAKKFEKNWHMAKYQKFFTLFFSTLHHTTCDKIGRLTIPYRLIQAVKIDRSLVIAGVLKKIEIWPKEIYDENLKKLLDGKDENMNLEKVTEEAFSLLTEEENDTILT